MRDSIVKSITDTIKDLNKSGLVDDITMRNIENLCLPEIQEYSPEKNSFYPKEIQVKSSRLGQHI
jgi:putative transcriptional regulator